MHPFLSLKDIHHGKVIYFICLFCTRCPPLTDEAAALQAPIPQTMWRQDRSRDASFKRRRKKEKIFQRQRFLGAKRTRGVIKVSHHADTEWLRPLTNWQGNLAFTFALLVCLQKLPVFVIVSLSWTNDLPASGEKYLSMLGSVGWTLMSALVSSTFSASFPHNVVCLMTKWMECQIQIGACSQSISSAFCVLLFSHSLFSSAFILPVFLFSSGREESKQKLGSPDP